MIGTRCEAAVTAPVWPSKAGRGHGTSRHDVFLSFSPDFPDRFQIQILIPRALCLEQMHQMNCNECNLLVQRLGLTPHGIFWPKFPICKNRIDLNVVPAKPTHSKCRLVSILFSNHFSSSRSESSFCLILSLSFSLFLSLFRLLRILPWVGRITFLLHSGSST